MIHTHYKRLDDVFEMFRIDWREKWNVKFNNNTDVKNSVKYPGYKDYWSSVEDQSFLVTKKKNLLPSRINI